jgi:hypothetical protein
LQDALIELVAKRQESVTIQEFDKANGGRSTFYAFLVIKTNCCTAFLIVSIT